MFSVMVYRIEKFRMLDKNHHGLDKPGLHLGDCLKKNQKLFFIAILFVFFMLK